MIVKRKSLIEDHTPTPEKWAEARRLARKTLAEMTPEEDAAITADAMADPDSGWMTDEEFAEAPRVPLSKVLGLDEPTLRLDADVAERLRAKGSGWEERANEILRKALAAA